MADIEKERAEFERTMRMILPSLARYESEFGVYVHPNTARAWDAWLARAERAEAAQRVPQGCDILLRVIQRLNSNPYSLTKSECIREIEAMLAAAPESPQAAQRVSLTEGQIVEIRDEHLPSQGECFDCIAFARAIEAAHGVTATEPKGERG